MYHSQLPSLSLTESITIFRKTETTVSIVKEIQSSFIIFININPIWLISINLSFFFRIFRSPSTICGTTVDHHTTATQTVFPKFDQFHIVLATVKSFRLNTTTVTTPDRVSIVLLSQKHVYNGIVFKLYEFYGIENHPSKFSMNNLNDRRKISLRKKSLVKVVTTPTISENEAFLSTNSTNR